MLRKRIQTKLTQARSHKYKLAFMSKKEKNHDETPMPSNYQIYKIIEEVRALRAEKRAMSAEIDELKANQR